MPSVKIVSYTFKKPLKVQVMQSARIFTDNPTPYAYRVSFLTNRYTSPLSRYLESEHGLLWHEWVVVFCLAQQSGWSATNIGDATGRPKNTISRAVRKLLKLRLIKRQSHPDDARLQLLSLTRQGKTFYEKVLPRIQAVEHDIYSGLNKAELAQFARLLEKLVSHVGAQTE